ncbi:unnamed protein product [Peronospora belbahrii]|uniref:Arrestin C-terminal-like domain-containing protein n=1 Tax=Peronospora belbahrii TaxID=622444 RepID=A0AAU9L1M9_9STRA|nr:unnamed protein product [Peronospora belbahrii]CAH0517698.1 unnamed protein product [Peronospora belbahrii]
MRGTVVVSIMEPLYLTSLVLRICGKEMITWNEGGGQAAAVYLREHLHLNEEVMLNTKEQVYQPGEYVYPLCFPLRNKLCNSFHIWGRDAGVMCRIDASLNYTATAILTVKDKFAADIQATKSFVVQHPPVGAPIQSLKNSRTADIRMLHMMKKGTCAVSAQLPSNVCIAGETLLAQTEVYNDTSKDMNKLSMMLYEDMIVHMGTFSRNVEGSMCVSRQDFPGVKAGITQKQVLCLHLVTKTSPPRLVSAVIQSHFLTTTHRLVIKGKFRFCPSVSVDFPVAILRKPAMEAAHVPTAVVLPAVAATIAVQSDDEVEVMPVAAAPRRKSTSDGRRSRNFTSMGWSPTNTRDEEQAR